jgi:predicted AAA+ superfamily ATPase
MITLRSTLTIEAKKPNKRMSQFNDLISRAEQLISQLESAFQSTASGVVRNSRSGCVAYQFASDYAERLKLNNG